MTDIAMITPQTTSNLLTAPRADEQVLMGPAFARVWWRWVSRVTLILSGREPMKVAEYTVADLPDAAKWSRCIVYVTDEAGGEVLAVSDGSVWRRQTDLAEVTI